MILFREVELRKFFEVAFCRFIVCVRRFFDGLVSPQVKPLVIYPDTRFPSLFCLVPGNATITRCVVSVFGLAVNILLIRNYSQIFAAIVESITVYVVNNRARGRKSNNQMMNLYRSGSINRFASSVFLCAPSVLIKNIKHIVIDDCLITFSKFNFFSQCVTPFYGRLFTNIVLQKVAL